MPARRVGRQLRLVPALLVPTTHAVGWGPPLAAFTVSLGLLALAVRPGSVLEAEELVRWLRIAMSRPARSAGPSCSTIPASPPPRAWPGRCCCAGRCGWRCCCPPRPPGGSRWCGGSGRSTRRLSLPVAAFTLEAAALLAVTLALAAAGSRLAPERRGGVVAAPALLALAFAATLLPGRVALYAQPGSAAWDGAHRRWALLLGLALAAFAAASRDPAHRRLPSQLRRLAHVSPAAARHGRKPGAQESLDAAGRVERSAG